MCITCIALHVYEVLVWHSRTCTCVRRLVHIVYTQKCAVVIVSSYDKFIITCFITAHLFNEEYDDNMIHKGISLHFFSFFFLFLYTQTLTHTHTTPSIQKFSLECSSNTHTQSPLPRKCLPIKLPLYYLVKMINSFYLHLLNMNE